MMCLGSKSRKSGRGHGDSSSMHVGGDSKETAMNQAQAEGQGPSLGMSSLRLFDHMVS